MTNAQSAYEEDVRRHPTYSGGYPRKTWSELSHLEKSSWVRNPRPREWIEWYYANDSVKKYALKSF